MGEAIRERGMGDEEGRGSRRERDVEVRPEDRLPPQKNASVLH